MLIRIHGAELRADQTLSPLPTLRRYAAFATSSYTLHSLLGAIGTAQAIVLAVSKPVAAKVADGKSLLIPIPAEIEYPLLIGYPVEIVFGRAEAMTLLVIFYVVGYASESAFTRPLTSVITVADHRLISVVAGSNNIHTYAAGAIIFEVGYASLQ